MLFTTSCDSGSLIFQRGFGGRANESHTSTQASGRTLIHRAPRCFRTWRPYTADNQWGSDPRRTRTQALDWS